MPAMPVRTRKQIEPVIEPLDEPEPMSPEIAEDVEIQPQDADETFTFKRNHFYALVTVLAFATGVLLGYVVWGFDSSGGAAQTTAALAEVQVTPEQRVTRYNVPIDGFYSIGPNDAPITLVEFSDYQCPFCRRWHQEVYEPLLAAYPGKIKLVYRNLPLTSIHPDAMSAAEAAMCAGDQDAYWPYHEKLFSNETLGTQTYIQYAQELSLNVDAFTTCLDEHKYQAAIEADSKFAIDLGVSSTPTFFLNGLPIVGAQPLNVMKQIIDKELAGKIPQ
jgi:protein-disulfide isomerase